jgi:16S rRNA (cytosine1402-N4)-methyltransferase
VKGVVSIRPRTMRSRSIVTAGGKSSSALSPVVTVERLQMAPDTYHQPVLEREVVDLFAPRPAGVLVDATLGGGGHAAALLDSAPARRVLGVDRDPAARAAAGERLAPYGKRVRIVAGTLAELGAVVEGQSDFLAGEPVAGVLMDLGVSSRQLDDPTRGFSFRADAPLDMRMDPTTGPSARDLIVDIDEATFARLLRDNGEARYARALARAVKEAAPATTGELVAVVERVVPPAHRRRGHVATRVFQALRVAVNAEVEQLSLGLEAALDLVDVEGIVVVISYHSGEDRAVKAMLAEAASGGCTCPPELGCVCGAIKRVVVGRASAILATPGEVMGNPRARSARLRWARKVAP